jgi:hypothetical protein
MPYNFCIMRKYLAFALIVGLAWGEASIVQGENRAGNGGGNAQSAEPDKRGTEESPFVVNEHPIQSKEEAAEEARKDAEQNRVNERIINLTFAIAICAGLQFLGILGQIFVYWRQTKIMEATLSALSGQAATMATQAGYMERQTKILEDSVAAAKASARAANDQIDMMKQKEQARIQAVPLDFDAVDPAEPNKIMIEFVNVGPTNAFDVRVEAGAQVTVEGLRQQVGEYTDLAIATLLKPDKTESSWVVWDFPPRWQDQVVDGKVRITFELMGQIKYRDVFESVHTDNFSYRMNVYGIEHLPRHFIQLKLMRKWYSFDPNPEDFNF